MIARVVGGCKPRCRRALVLTHDALFREGNLPDKFWLHNSGKLLTGTYVWHETDPGRIRQVQLL